MDVPGEDYLPLRGRWLGYFGQGLMWLVKGLAILGFFWILIRMQPCFLCQTKKGQIGSAKAQIGNFKTAIELYRVDHHGKPPGDLLDLIVNSNRYRSGGDPWNGPYLQDVTSIPADPWGNPYVYNTSGSSEPPYEIISFGEDGKPGGTGNAEDLCSNKRNSSAASGCNCPG